MTDTGTSILIAYGTMKEGAVILPPRAAANGLPAKPGVRATVQVDGAVLLEAVGYPDGPSANTAIARADQACVAAGLQVKTITPPGAYPARMVRKAP